ncbi:maleylpyruvate isomerase family mycothiol-dependent enzyme [Terrabacter carboxydivorans]|uniref:Maleylpyruvate isomerase family mycothiol-dependent enzyme n=1 Tax=Terrabacter carboxydivorans TaxID=619730 RepID=A0ABP5ZNI9_9MICO
MSAVTAEVADQVAGELSELADLLAGLPAAAWDAPSLCPGWRVREVVAHMTLPMHASPPVVLLGLLRARMRWDVLADRRARLDARRTPEQLLAALRAPRMLAWTPPGGGATGALVHAVVHGLDITEALAVGRRPPAARTRIVLDGLTVPRSLTHFGVALQGMQLQAEDLDWSYGSGRVVRAPAAELALILSGRRLADPEASKAV